MNECVEFRPVHAARNALQLYLESNKDLNVLYSIPIHLIGRYDVWQCVFEKEPEAYKVLQEKELRRLISEYVKDGTTMYLPGLLIHLFERATEANEPLTAADGIEIALDGVGDDFLSALIKEAETSIKRKRQIISKYTKQDTQWIDYSITVLQLLKDRQKKV